MQTSRQSPLLPFSKYHLLQGNPILAFSIKQKFKFLHCSMFLTNAPVELTVPSSKDVRKHQSSGQEWGLWQPHRWNNISWLPRLRHPSFGPDQRVFHFLVSSISLSTGGWIVEQEKKVETPAGYPALQDFKCCWRSKIPGRSGVSRSSSLWRNAHF